MRPDLFTLPSTAVVPQAEFIGPRARHHEPTPGHRVREFEALSVKHQAAGLERRPAITRIAHYGRTRRCEVNPDLVFPPGHRPRFNQQPVRPTLQNSNERDRSDSGLADADRTVAGDNDWSIDA